VRATSSLRERVAGMRGKLRLLAGGKWEPADLQGLIELQQRAASGSPRRRSSTRSRRRTRKTSSRTGLEDHGCTDAWLLAPVFVQGGLDTAWLDRVLARSGPT